jgi:hypothetical protein
MLLKHKALGLNGGLRNLMLIAFSEQLLSFPSSSSCRRMFPSMRVSLSGLDNDQNYCVLLEMVPIADCRFKFSGSQWVPAGGAEPQSLQNIYIHPDSPALGSHWQAQPINFNKTKLTNNTLDSNGHVSIIDRLSGFLRCFVLRVLLKTQNGVKEASSIHLMTDLLFAGCSDQHAQIPAPHPHRPHFGSIANPMVAAEIICIQRDGVCRCHSLSGNDLFSFFYLRCAPMGRE